MVLLDALQLIHNEPNEELALMIYQKDCLLVTTQMKDLTFAQVRDYFYHEVEETVFNTEKKVIRITIDWN
mgnify:CR=1 FL=1